MNGSEHETLDGESADPRWSPLTVEVAAFELTVCAICAAVVPDQAAMRRRHDEWHAAIRRALTP
jgi:hypothetical protein